MIIEENRRNQTKPILYSSQYIQSNLWTYAARTDIMVIEKNRRNQTKPILYSSLYIEQSLDVCCQDGYNGYRVEQEKLDQTHPLRQSFSIQSNLWTYAAKTDIMNIEENRRNQTKPILYFSLVYIQSNLWTYAARTDIMNIEEQEKLDQTNPLLYILEQFYD